MGIGDWGLGVGVLGVWGCGGTPNTPHNTQKTTHKKKK